MTTTIHTSGYPRTYPASFPEHMASERGKEQEGMRGADLSFTHNLKVEVMPRKCLSHLMKTATAEGVTDDFWRQGNEQEERRGVGEKRSGEV